MDGSLKMPRLVFLAETSSVHGALWLGESTDTAWWCYFTILKNDGVRQWVKDDIPYMKWKIIQSSLKAPTRIDYYEI